MHILIGLACSMGVQFGANNSRHHGEKDSHSHEKPHQHEGAASHAHDHGDVTGKAHSHETSVPPHEHGATGTHDESEKDDCCSDEVVQISLLDKALTSMHAQITVPSTLLSFTLYAYVLTTYNYDFGFIKLRPPNIRSWPLATHSDLRIAIQSFQI